MSEKVFLVKSGAGFLSSVKDGTSEMTLDPFKARRFSFSWAELAVKVLNDLDYDAEAVELVYDFPGL